jgi:hypothetical protein
MDTETKNETKKVVVIGEGSGPGGREVGACMGCS